MTRSSESDDHRIHSSGSDTQQSETSDSSAPNSPPASFVIVVAERPCHRILGGEAPRRRRPSHAKVSLTVWNGNEKAPAAPVKAPKMTRMGRTPRVQHRSVQALFRGAGRRCNIVESDVNDAAVLRQPSSLHVRLLFCLLTGLIDGLLAPLLVSLLGSRSFRWAPHPRPRRRFSLLACQFFRPAALFPNDSKN